MHSLIFKRPDSPKRMENVKQELKDFDKLEFPISKGGVEHDLFPSTVVVPADEFYCQPCHLPPSLSRHLPHSSTCSYGIQALLHNVHRGYAMHTDGGDRTPDQIMSFTDERDEASQQHESEILRWASILPNHTSSWVEIVTLMTLKNWSELTLIVNGIVNLSLMLMIRVSQAPWDRWRGFPNLSSRWKASLSPQYLRTFCVWASSENGNGRRKKSYRNGKENRKQS